MAMQNFHYGICFITVVSLSGCAVNPQEASPDSIAQSVKESAMVIGQDFVRRGRALRVSHYRSQAGKPWSDEEDQELLAEFDTGNTVAVIASNHGRTEGAISSRLAKLGKI